MPPAPHIGVTVWRAPRTYEGTLRDKRIKRLSIHFTNNGTTVYPPEVFHEIIRWAQPTDAYDNAYGIIDERTTMWIPRHAIVNSPAGRTAPEFGRSGEGEEVMEEDKEFWNLWQ